MKCIKCENVDLEKKNFYGIEVEKCPNCHGIWFDENEIKDIKEIDDENKKIDEFVPSKIEDSVNKKENLRCIKCDNILSTINYMGDSGIFIDKCSVCGGIWLDAGEFTKICNYLKIQESDLENDLEKFSQAFKNAKDISEEKDKKIKESVWLGDTRFSGMVRGIFKKFRG
jgi:Zn-finger nucleic acid-binding protein